MTPQFLLTAKQVAEFCQFLQRDGKPNPKRVRELVRQGKLPQPKNLEGQHSPKEERWFLPEILQSWGIEPSEIESSNHNQKQTLGLMQKIQNM